MASILVNLSEGVVGVISVHVRCSKRVVASVLVNLSEGAMGMAFVSVSP